jgi:hypothetical protein
MPSKSSKVQHAAIDKLRDLLKPGDIIYTTLKHVSRSGMMRVIDVRVMRNNEPLRISWSVAQAIGYAYNDKHDGVRMDGCGMDMGFALVYRLGSVLWPNGTPEPHGTRNGEPDTCGGYALKHRWM